MLRAAFFDVGDTLLRARGERATLRAAVRARLVERFGERAWYDELLAADLLEELLVDDPAEPLRQRTLVVLGRWLDRHRIPHDDLDLDDFRRHVEVPRELGATLAPGTRDVLAWLRDRGLRVGVISNTLWTGDDEMRADLPRVDLADLVDVVVTSHTTGFRKPHRAIFERALSLAGAPASASFMVGDEPYADVLGAKRAGMRAVWLRLPPPRPHPVGAPPDLHVDPDARVSSLPELPEVVETWLRTDRA